MAADARPVAAPPIPLPEGLDVDALILPREVKDGEGLYHDSVVTLAKDLRAAGITAEYQYDPKSRLWIGEKHLSPAELEFIVALGAHAAWQAMASLLRLRHAAGPVRARVARVRKSTSSTDWEWFDIEGSGDDVAAALQALASSDDSPDSNEASE